MSNAQRSTALVADLGLKDSRFTGKPNKPRNPLRRHAPTAREGVGVSCVVPRFDAVACPEGIGRSIPPNDIEAACCSVGQPAPKKPTAYSTAQVREACRRLRAVVRQPAPDGLHRLTITEAEFLHLHAAVSHDRNKTRKAIGKGNAAIGDLRATDSLWDKLQAVMFERIYGRQA